jgi:hypothetical protein
MVSMSRIVDEAALVMAVQERDFYKQEWARLILYCATLEERNDRLDEALRSRSDSVSGRASIIVRAGGSNDNRAG